MEITFILFFFFKFSWFVAVGPQFYQNLLMVLPSVFFLNIMHIPLMSRQGILGSFLEVPYYQDGGSVGFKVLNVTPLMYLDQFKSICPQRKLYVVMCTDHLKFFDMLGFAYFVKTDVQYDKSCFCNFIVIHWSVASLPPNSYNEYNDVCIYVTVGTPNTWCRLITNSFALLLAKCTSHCRPLSIHEVFGMAESLDCDLV